MAVRLPAEWEPQRAVLLTWPRIDGDFGSDFDAVEAVFFRIAAAIADHQAVWISTAGDTGDLHQRLIEQGIDAGRLHVVHAQSDDVWVRDHGPITVVNHQSRHLDFRFNGWGGKFPAERDDRLTRTLARHGVLPHPVESIDYVLEGGAIDSDGAGTLLTTSACVLNASRNGEHRAGFAARMRRWLGVERVIWLDHGALAGDDTDGHVDTLARFASTDTIVFQGCSDEADPHHKSLSAMREQLTDARQADRSPYRLVELPMPAPVHDDDGKRLPAGYANFLIINGAVLVPTYNDPADREALSLLSDIFAPRRVIGIDCLPLIRQYGSLHCVTMQIPD